MQTICSVCKLSAATTVLNSQPYCGQCAAASTRIDPTLPTIGKSDMHDGSRVCQKCGGARSSLKPVCALCGFTDLSLVDDLQVEEAKSPVKEQPIKADVTPNPCWTCAHCSYEYNLDSVCRKCKAKKGAERQKGCVKCGAKNIREGKCEKCDGGMMQQKQSTSSFVHPAITAGDDSPDDFDSVLDCEHCGQPNCQCPASSRLSHWQCLCGHQSLICYEQCESCAQPYLTSVRSPWLCVNCAQRSTEEVCPTCRCKKGWSAYLKKHGVVVNEGRWMWRCRECEIWNRVDLSTCFCGLASQIANKLFK